MEFHEKLYQLRKEANLSQEQLAERLHVSRQAVGKWENGSALPDISNIIELSKLFNVSLNELLQVDYSEDKNVSIDEVLIKNLDLKSKKQQRRNNILFVVLGVLCLVLMMMVNKQNEKIDQLQDQLIYQYDSIVGQINGIYYQPSYSTTSTLFEMSDVIFGEPNYEVELVNATVKVALKEFKDSTNLQFRISEDGNEYVIDAKSVDGGIFEASIDVNMKSNSVVIYGIVENDGYKQTEEIDWFNDLHNKFYGDLYVYDQTSYYTSSYRKDYTIKGKFAVTSRGIEDKHYFTDLVIQYVKDGEVLLSESVSPNDLNHEGYHYYIYMEEYKDTLEVPIEVQIIYHDNFGNEYTKVISKYYLDEAGPRIDYFAEEEAMYS